MESSDKAWEKFVANSKVESVQKASLADKLDILASQLNEVVTNTRNVAKLAPELMGDQSAIDAANSMAPPGDTGMGMGEEGMGGLPNPEEFAEEMTSQLGGEGDMTNPDEEMIDEQGAPTGDVPPEMPPEMPPLEEGAAPPMPEEDIPPMPEESPAPPMPEAPMGDVPPEVPMPEMGEVPPAMDMYTSDVAFEDLIMTLTDELHDAVDAEDYAKVDALNEKLKAMKSVWAGFGNAPVSEEAMSTAGAEDMVPPEVIDALAGGAAPEIPPEALMKSEKEDEPKEKEEDKEGEDKAPEVADDEDDSDDGFEIEEAMIEEEPLPEVDPMVQGLMGLMQILDAGDVEGAKAMIAALLEQAAPVAKSEDVPEGDMSGDMGGDMGGDTEPVAMSDGEDVLSSDSEDVEKGCDSVEKSEQFHMESITELIARRNGYNSPNTASGVGGNIMRPSSNPFAVRKSVIGTGACDNPLRASVDADWERYKLYKHKDSF